MEAALTLPHGDV